MPAFSISTSIIGVHAATQLYFATAIWPRASDVPSTSPEAGAIYRFHDSKITYYVQAPAFEHLSGRVDVPWNSPVRVLENSLELRPAHAKHVNIITRGMGRFAHWTEVGFIFTSRDGTNPLTNGHNHWAVIRPLADQPL